MGCVLFGSVATGSIHDKSDIDLAVIYDLDPPDMREDKEEKR